MGWRVEFDRGLNMTCLVKKKPEWQLRDSHPVNSIRNKIRGF
jgi:hypothetical protein